MARAAHHFNFTRRQFEREASWIEPTTPSVGDAVTCEGFVRRLYVRPGGAGWSEAVGWLCDGCGAVWLDVGYQAAIGQTVERSREYRRGEYVRDGEGPGALAIGPLSPLRRRRRPKA